MFSGESLTPTRYNTNYNMKTGAPVGTPSYDACFKMDYTFISRVSLIRYET